MYRIQHFTIDEFNCPCCGYNNIDNDFLRLLDMAREIADTKFIITSGCRCKKHNINVGGKQKSSHLNGLAVDIHAETSTKRYKILDALLIVGFKRVGIGKDFLHVDNDLSKPQGVVWLY